MGQGVAAGRDDSQCALWKAAGKLQRDVGTIAEAEQDGFFNAKVVQQGGSVASHVVDGKIGLFVWAGPEAAEAVAALPEAGAEKCLCMRECPGTSVPAAVHQNYLIVFCRFRL